MKKELFGLLVVIIILLYLFDLFPFLDENQQYILRKLGEEYKTCEIIKYENNEVWLICNGRPFYATFDGTNVKYQLNGWSFLEKDNVLDKLENCEFYKSEKNSENIDLFFYCDISSARPMLKKFSFNLNELKTSKIGEVDFLPVLLEDLGEAYPELKNCIAIKNNVVNYQVGYINKIDLDCRGHPKTMYTKLEGMFPLIEKPGLSQTERADYVFNEYMDGRCSISDKKIDENNENHIVIDSVCSSLPFDISAQYFFPPYSYIWTYNLTKKGNNVEEYIIQNLLDKFIINPPEPRDYELIGSYEIEKLKKNVIVYRVGDETIKFFEKENKIVLIERVCNSMVCIE
jgi:hypothetical protein